MANTILVKCDWCGKDFERIAWHHYNKTNPQGVFCSRKHWHEFRARRFTHFWDSVDKSGGPDACWHWQGTIGLNGYGVIRYKGKDLYAHRRSYELTYGNLPEASRYRGLEIRHKCDNPRCVNPSHLIPGTHADNGRDMAERERSPTTKLTASQVIQIRSDPRRDAEIGDSYGISRATVYNIKKRNIWRHIP